VLRSRALAQRAVECSVLLDSGSSDHAPVLAKFALEPTRYEALPPAAPQPAGQLHLF